MGLLVVSRHGFNSPGTPQGHHQTIVLHDIAMGDFFSDPWDGFNIAFFGTRWLYQNSY